ncbi:hypothetical protein [Acetobacterium tundrae]|uniref:Uncharacterized protein n=1 Tax=Acetobacterium tundrae TaxID=132932 RepID=A0ABR6WNF4_9FIRM|nr:hypothetical protein [Acetobacterium tundrae]MBC3798033.1 hypothetical protein [Acetobacterium tundrae]
MAITYTYDPGKLDVEGMDLMRLEIGDTFVDGGKKTCALCDEEYSAIISKHPDNWNNAKYACVCAIVNKLAFQNDYSSGGMSLSLSQRFTQWQELKKEMAAAYGGTVPVVAFNDNVGNATDSLHYFSFGMHDIMPGEEGA